MKILLDFDGVMVTTPMWRPVVQLDDGFMAFNETCAQNLAKILAITQATIVLTTTHRIHYDNEKWRELLSNRGIITQHISKVNDAQTIESLGVRCEEVMNWVSVHPNEPYLIIDDDKSLRNLPDTIKRYWIETSFHRGFDAQAKTEALTILQAYL